MCRRNYLDQWGGWSCWGDPVHSREDLLWYCLRGSFTGFPWEWDIVREDGCSMLLLLILPIQSHVHLSDLCATWVTSKKGVWSGPSAGLRFWIQGFELIQLVLVAWIGKIPCSRKQSPTPASLPGESCGQRSLVGYSPWGCTESEATKETYMHALRFHFLFLRWILLFHWDEW